MHRTTPTRPNLPKLCFHSAKNLYFARLNGHTIYFGRDRAAAENAYRREIAEWLGRGMQPPAPPGEELTITGLVARHRRYAIQYYAAAPKNLERITVTVRPLLKLYADAKVISFSPACLRTVRDYMIRDLKWCRGFCNTATNTIRRLFKWGVAEGLVNPDVFNALACLEPLRRGFTDARETPPREGADLTEIEAIKEYLPAVVYDACRVLYLTGARPSEVLLLRVANIDRSDPDVWRAALAAHKTEYLGKTRTLFFGNAAQAILRPYMLKSVTDYVFDPKEAMAAMRDRRRAERVTPESCGNKPGSNVKEQPERNPGEHYTPDSFRRAITRAVTSANRQRKADNIQRKVNGLKELPMLRDFSPYMLRHGRALELRAKEGLDAVAAVLGHSHLRMAEHYGKISEAQARGVASRLG